jgi:nitric oxide reductase subunit C
LILKRDRFLMPGTRLFLLICCAIGAALIAVPLLNSSGLAAMPDAASRGFAIWEREGCAACHSLLMQGGSFAPDLTHIDAQRGAAYLRSFLENPSAYHPDAARQMPRPDLTVSETDDVIALLAWVGGIDPAQRVQTVFVSGSGARPAAGVEIASAPAITDPATLGRALFSRAPANCATCHSLEPGVRIIGPSLAGIAERAAQRVPGMSAEAYIRASILRPGEYLVEGYENVMAQNLGEILTVDDVNNLIAFLLTLEAES